MNKMRFKLSLLLLALVLIPSVYSRGKTYEDIPNMAKSNGKKHIDQ